MNSFFVITNMIKDPSLVFTEKVCAYLTKHGARCFHDPEDADKADCVLVIGGDGTVLRAAEQFRDRQIPVLGINLGTIGYLAEVEKNRWEQAMQQVLAGDYVIEERMLLEGRMLPARGEKMSGEGQVLYALNDAVIQRTGLLHVFNYNVYVNGHPLYAFNADGVIVSTPTGSTAYNLSAGGPIVEPTARLILLTPICPHTLNTRSVVLSAGDVIEIEIGSTTSEPVLDATAAFDGSGLMHLVTGQCVEIRSSEKNTLMLRLNHRSFLETLHNKMYR